MTSGLLRAGLLVSNASGYRGASAQASYCLHWDQAAAADCLRMDLVGSVYVRLQAAYQETAIVSMRNVRSSGRASCARTCRPSAATVRPTGLFVFPEIRIRDVDHVARRQLLWAVSARALLRLGVPRARAVVVEHLHWSVQVPGQRHADPAPGHEQDAQTDIRHHGPRAAHRVPAGARTGTRCLARTRGVSAEHHVFRVKCHGLAQTSRSP